MPVAVPELLAQSERSYFAGALKDAIHLLASHIDHGSFERLPPRDQATLRLQLGKLLVTAVFMEGGGGAAARQHLDLVKQLGSPNQHASAIDLVGLSLYYEQLSAERSDFTSALREFEAAMQARQAWSDPRELSESELHLGLVAQQTGQHEAALERFKFAYELASGGDHKVEMSFAVRHIGFLRRTRGELGTAYECMAESLRLRQEIGMTIYLPFSHLSLADAASALDRFEEAAVHYERAGQLAREIGNKRAQLLTTLGLGRFHKTRERWTEARSRYLEARALALEIDHRVALAEAAEALGSLPDQPG
jgi:tetratricopeptide (TPR) repeat protein